MAQIGNWQNRRRGKRFCNGLCLRGVLRAGETRERHKLRATSVRASQPDGTGGLCLGAARAGQSEKAQSPGGASRLWEASSSAGNCRRRSNAIAQRRARQRAWPTSERRAELTFESCRWTAVQSAHWAQSARRSVWGAPFWCCASARFSATFGRESGETWAKSGRPSFASRSACPNGARS